MSRPANPPRWLVICCALVLVALLAVVHELDYRDEVRSADVACEMVADGYWPESQCPG